MDNPDLGSCCVCEKNGPDVRNILMLHFECPMPGRGWGCLVCNLPMNGAVAVVCDDCLEQKRELRFACRGYPAEDGRVPIGELTTPFDHEDDAHYADQETIYGY